MVQEYTDNRDWPIPIAGTKPWYEAFKLLMNTTDADFQDMIDDLGLNTSTGFLRDEYDDIFPGGTFVTPQGASAPDDVTITISGIPYRYKAFDGGTTEESLSNTFEITHGVDLDAVNAGTIPLEVHVHTMSSTTGSGSAIFNFDWVYHPPGAAPIAMASVPITCDYGSNNQYWHVVDGAELTLPTGGYAIGGIIGFNIRRKPTVTGDNYAADALLMQVALHAPFNSRGSRQRYIK